MSPSSSNIEQNIIYNFDNYALDPKSRTLRHGQGVVELTPKLFQTLLVLVENHDHIMSKDELLSSIWPEQIVEESNITQNISVLRKVLGETTRGKKYIETFPGHGYRFSEPVAIGRNSQSDHETDVNTIKTPVDDPSVQGLSDHHHRLLPIPAPKHNILNYRGYIVTAILCLLAGAIFSAIVLSRKIRSEKLAAVSPRASQVEVLTRMEGAQYQPSLSPDGKQIAFVSTAPNDSRSAIYIQSLRDLQPHRVAYGSGQYSSPVWSPDGQSLAYVRIQPNQVEIFILNLARSTSTRLTTLFPRRYGLNYRHLDWSPDGKMLVVDDKSVEADPLSLYLVYVSNGNKVRLTYPDMDIIGDISPRFSPDGAQVVFIRMKYQFLDDLFTVPITGGVARRLTDRSSLLSDADWESNHSIVFSGKQDGAYRFWRMDLQASQPRRNLASSIETDMPPLFSISPASHQVVFSAYHPDLNIWALDLSRKIPAKANHWTRVIQTSGQDIAPVFSPDGKRISFRSDASGKMQLWVSNADGSNAFRVRTGSMIPAVNCWAPDGNSIVFSPRSSPGLYEVSLAHDFHLWQVTPLPVSHPFYSVNGKWIFARIHNFIYRIPPTGGSALQITDQGGAPLAESTDGNYLYFSQGRMSSTISRVDLGTRHQETVLDSLIPGYRESWALAPDGIIFLTERSGRTMIAFHDFATGREREIAEFPGALPPVGMSSFSVSPDEQRLLVVRAEPVSANIQITKF